LVALEALKELGYDVHLSSLCTPNLQQAKHNFNKEVNVSSITIPRFVFQNNRINLIRSTIAYVAPRVQADVYVNMMAHWFPFFKPKNPKKLIMYVGALPKVSIFDNNGLNSNHASPLSKALNFVAAKKLQKLLEYPMVLTASHYLKNILSTVWGVEANVLYPPVDFAAYQSSMEDIQNKDTKSIALVGRLHSFKNFEMGISVAEKLHDIELGIIGAVEKEGYFDSIKLRIMNSSAKNRITTHLNMPLKSRADILKRSKVFVHAAVGEGFGGAIVEAMAAGCIPVVRNSGGPTEFVPKKWRYDNLDECLDKVEAALDASPNEHMEMVKIAEQFREEHYKRTFVQYLEKFSN
jgi:glycosyltransferase involved in cell wall biosynthesis